MMPDHTEFTRRGARQTIKHTLIGRIHPGLRTRRISGSRNRADWLAAIAARVSEFPVTLQ